MGTTLEISAPLAYREARSVLTFDEAKLLATQRSTPLLVVSRSTLIRNYETLKENLPGVQFFYAVKANPDHLILTTLAELGCSADVCSYGEARAALWAGFEPNEMIHTHPCKVVQNLVECYKAGIRWFTFDSQYELPKLAEFAPDANLLLRLAVSTSSSVIDLSAKFGAAPQDALMLIKRAGRMGLEVRGISFHVGSQCLSPNDFNSALGQVRRIWDRATKAGFSLEVLDIGGGIPAPYRSAVLTQEAYCQQLAQALDRWFGDLSIRIIAEPGRCLCAEAVTLVTRVIGKSVRHGVNWYIIDDGLYGSFSGKVYDHADFPLIAENDGDRPLKPCIVAGPTCDSTDVVARDQNLPDLKIGELLLVPTMGAYTSASASDFNGLDEARSVAID